jgi:hypothetical protein
VTLVVAEGAVIVVKFQPNRRLLALTRVVGVGLVVVVRVEKGEQDVAALTGTAAKNLLSGSGVKTGANSTRRLPAS